MLDRSHRLKVGEVGIVGYVAGTGNPRIALDVGADAIFFNNPDLPETRSEMALPLIVRENVIGVIDLQSKEMAAFKEEDFEVFRTLADQVAIAIENSRLFGETRHALEETERTFGDFVRKGWQNIQQMNNLFGMRYSARGIQPLSEHLEHQEIKQALENNTVVSESEQTSAVAIPLTIRGEVIGVLDIRVPGKRVWSKEDIRVMQRITDRAALALENARLLDDAQRRADRERTVSQITTNIRSTTDPQSMVQTAVDELRRVLGVNDVVIRPFSQEITPSESHQTVSNDSKRKQSDLHPNPDQSSSVPPMVDKGNI